LRTFSISFRYSAAAPKPVKPQDSTGGVSARFLCAPSANTQAQIDDAAARDADLARRVASAGLNQQQGVRISDLQALVDGFITADRQFLQLPGGNSLEHESPFGCLLHEPGMATWERGCVHEYAGSKGSHHPTTEVWHTHHFLRWLQ
jgi:hypothetical protein